MTDSSSGSGIGIAGLLGVAFVVLKLTHVIDWSWLWVLAPFWAPIAIVVTVVVGGFVVAMITLGVAALFSVYQDRKLEKIRKENRAKRLSSSSFR